MATPRYWNANYWEANYWDVEFWAAESTGEIIGQIVATTSLDSVGGSYWGASYWASTYWDEDYWPEPGTTFLGTFSSNAASGLVNTTLDASPAAFVGSTTQVELFDIDVSFTVQWSFAGDSTFTGTIANTLDANTAVITGQFSEDFTGTIATTLEANPANFDGTHVAPANRSGVITTLLGDTGAAFVGLAVDPDGFTGSIAANTDVSGAFVGQYITTNTDGSIGVTLDDVNATWTGNFYSADTVVGTSYTTLLNTTANFAGTSTPPISWVEIDDDSSVWTEQSASSTTWTETA